MTAHDTFEAEVSSGPIVDNASTRLYYIGELQGARCAECGANIADDDTEFCDDCISGGAA